MRFPANGSHDGYGLDICFDSALDFKRLRQPHINMRILFVQTQTQRVLQHVTYYLALKEPSPHIPVSSRLVNLEDLNLSILPRLLVLLCPFDLRLGVRELVEELARYLV